MSGGVLKKIFDRTGGAMRCAVDLVLPRRCTICGVRMPPGVRRPVCDDCRDNLPLTRFRGRPGNVVERLFWGKVAIVRANSLMHYEAHGDVARAFMAFKYFDRPDVAVFFGEMMARDLIETDFFKEVDFIVPVPLSRKRRRKRGYNQSEKLARGVANVTGLPVREDVLERTLDNPTQTKLSGPEREENVKDIFKLRDESAVSGRHILVVDDVLTFGYTLISCTQALCRAQGVRISVLTLGLAGGLRRVVFPHDIFPPGLEE